MKDRPPQVRDILLAGLAYARAIARAVCPRPLAGASLYEAQRFSESKMHKGATDTRVRWAAV